MVQEKIFINEKNKASILRTADKIKDIFCMAKKTFVMRKILNTGGGENSG
jgi:hypothetical protein